MTTGVVCTVYVDGVRAADGSAGDDLSNPVVLDDLAVTWGRADTMAQPDPDTCSFDVMDAAGGTAFGDVYRTGRRVDVVATGETYPDPTVPTFINPGFDTATVTWTATDATATRSTTRVQTGTHSLAVKPTTGVGGSVLLAPGPFSAPGTDPDAWDAIPTTSPGQSWSSAISLLVPTGAAVAVRPVRFSGPYATAGTVLAPVQTVTGNGTWQTATYEATTQTAGAWIGVQLDIFPTGLAWDEMPPTLTWNGVDPTLQWDELGTVYVDDVTILAPGDGTGRGVLVFSGRITDLSAAWDDVVGGPVVRVTAAGFTADLQNRTIGGEPWTVESVDERAHRILELAGLPITIDIADTLDVILLSYRDVDAQGATGLLTEIATSVDGVLWPAVHQTIGAYLVLEDPSQRASLLQLVDVPGPPDAEAFGAVATVRTNLATNPRATALTVASGALGWLPRWFGSAPGAGTTTLVTGAADGPPGVSTYARKTWTVAPAGASDVGFAHTNSYSTTGTSTTGKAVTAGTTYTFSSYVRSSRAVAAAAAWGVRLVWRDAAGAFLSTVAGANTALPAGTWQRMSFVSTAPAGAAFVEVLSSNNANMTGIVAGDTLDGTALLMEAAAVVLPYFDGTTPAAGDFTYQWSGTADASTSIQRAPQIVGANAYGGPARWSSVVEHDGGARSWGFLPLVVTPQGLILTVPNVATGQTITATLRVKGAAGLLLQLQARTSTGGGINPPTLVTCTGAWETVTYSATAVAGTTLVGVQLVTRSPYAVGVPFYVDRAIVVVEPAPYTGPYFDGRTPDTELIVYAWTGAADASTSTQTTVQQHTIEIAPKDPDTGFNLSACQVLRDPVTWHQSVADLVTRVAVGWLVQGVDDDGLPTTTDSTVQVVDAGLEALYGTRRVQVSTQLQAADDATDVADRILARTSATDWRADGVTLDDDEIPAGPEGVALLLDLLDGTSRIGAPVVLGEMPSWTPAGASAGVYLEGGTYRFVGGRWVLELLISSAAGLGRSAAWDELDPAWTWNRWDPAITWNDLRGVAAP
jgi:hypothetical protein